MTASRRLSRAAVSAVAAALALGLVAGCGDEGEADPSDESPAAASSATEASAAPASYLPVPEGVTLTEPGTELRLRETATVAWRPRQDAVVALDVAVQRIDVTSFAESFDGWVVTRQMKDQTPYFVHLTVRNLSDADAGGLLVPVYGVDDTALMVEPLRFHEKTFAPCPGGALPRKLAPGRRTELCLVYLAPAGRKLTAVAFDPAGDREPVSWTGRITEVVKPGKNDDRSRRNRG